MHIKHEKQSKYEDVESLGMYLREIAKYKLLGSWEEADLARRMKAGDKEAREKLINSNLRLVVSNAKKYYGRGVPFVDLIQYGNEGLIAGTEKFNPKLGYRFSTYVGHWIRNCLSRAVQTHSGNIRIPPDKFLLIARYVKQRKMLAGKLQHEPTILEMSQYLRVGIKYIIQMEGLATIGKTISYDNHANEDGRSLEAKLGNDVDFDAGLRKLACNQARAGLDPREQAILDERFPRDGGKKTSLEDIGRKSGVSRERIRQIEARGLRRLRKPERAKKIRDFY